MNTKTRTTKEWFDTLPEPYRSQALMNTPYKWWGKDERDLEDALWGAFIWEYSPEGHDYWESLVVRAGSGEFYVVDFAALEVPVPLPKGYSRWEYRGTGWKASDVTYTTYCPARDNWDVAAYNGRTRGYSDLHYWEAIPLAKPAVVGYRLLGPDDVIREGDEWWVPGDSSWRPTRLFNVKAEDYLGTPRRRPILSYEDAPASS